MPLIVSIKVFPASGRQEWVFDNKAQLLKCYIKSAPERGRANKEVLKMIAEATNLPAREIFLLSGDKDRRKRFKINLDIDLSQFLNMLGLAQQHSIL